MTGLTATVEATGPLFDGSASQIVDNAVEAGRDAVAQEGVDMVRARLGSVLRHPTGRYESRIVVDRAVEDRPVITDGGIVYGPWLEGTSGRNDRSRFKGYRTFRIVAQELEQAAAAVAESAVGAVLEELSR